MLTYMIGAYAFSLVRRSRAVLRAASLALGGFFAAAMVTTRIIDVVYLVGLPLLYVAVSADLRGVRGSSSSPVTSRRSRSGRSCCWWHAGSSPSRTERSSCSSCRRSGSSGHLGRVQPDSRSTVAPLRALFLGSGLRRALRRRRPCGRSEERPSRSTRARWPRRSGWRSYTSAFALWQFLGDGWLFNLAYYFSSFLVPTLLCLTAARPC